MQPITITSALTSLQAQGLARLDAQLLLLHLLGQPLQQRSWLLTHDQHSLSPEQSDQLARLLERRLAGEPLAYLTGYKEFYGLDLQVDARVLVPRPDTETLVDWALECLQDGHEVLDLGTGSGAIALALKSVRSSLQVSALDVSAEALTVARSNARRLQLEVNFGQGSWFAGLGDAARRFDCIVANPPYIAALDPHLAALSHEPLQALASGADGLDDLRQICAAAPGHLKPAGWLLLEHGYDQASAVRLLLADAGFEHVQSRRDLSGIERCSGGQFNLTPSP